MLEKIQEGGPQQDGTRQDGTQRDDRGSRADLDDPGEIFEMVQSFYRVVAQDDVLGPMFNDVAQVNWAEHIPKLAAFWCRALLGMPGYVGNPMQAHVVIHRQRSFTAEHFERWLTLFDENLENWEGPRTERAWQVATNVARVHSSQLLDAPFELSLSDPAGR